ncbi:hypothetical protein F0562_029519 [Nyssa sinensis]|uniref:Retrovirus-related Pol polyprotein from transposon TNT 1-94-like beta-barrel domain-containing protein n=1 Tax=Nyssa sinensis TaxID=561372 RepID=A0A5J5B793_9ASTE|nr:hypothetical protein F0562_029519 [Nyssa sinensis]
MVTGCGLEHHLDHSEPVPLPVLADGSPNPAFKLWKRQDQLVLNWIVASVSEGVLPQLVAAPMASAAWNTLVSAYASGSKAHIRELRAQVHHLHRDTASIETYVVRAKDIANRLAALQHPVSDEELIEFVVAGLGPAYKLFTRMLECRTDDFDFDDLYGMLLTEERRLTREDAVAIIPSSAQFTQFSLPSFTRGHGRLRGGRARVCPSPKMNNSFRAPTKPSSNLVSTSSLTNQTWLLDSGTTHHLTADLDNLSIHAEYTGPEEVTLGNGSQLPITHIGTSHVLSDNRTAPSTLSALPPPFTLPHSTLVTERMCLDHSSSTPTTSLGMGAAPFPSSSSRLPPYLSACSGSPAATPSASVHNADVLVVASLDSSLASAAASPRRHPMVTRSQTGHLKP